MPIVVAPGLALLAQIQPEMEVTYSENGVYYAGRIHTITPADYWRADYLTLDVECQDYTSLLVDDICTSARSVPETDAQRISWLLQNFDRHGISAHHVQTLYSNMPNQDFTGLTLTAAITAVLAFSGGVFYVDDFKDLHTFVATENLTAPFALSDNPDGVTNFGYNSFRYPADSVDLRNAVLAIPPVSTYTAVDTLTETITYAPGAVTGGGCIASFKPRANGFISLVAAGPIAIGSTTSVSPTFASQTQAGNLAIAGVGAGTFDPTTSAPGWIKAVGETFGGPFNAIWYKANVSNGEIAPTFTAVGGSSAMFAQLIEISGADPINPLDRTGSSGTASTTLVIPNSVTQALILCLLRLAGF